MASVERTENQQMVVYLVVRHVLQHVPARKQARALADIGSTFSLSANDLALLKAEVANESSSGTGQAPERAEDVLEAVAEHLPPPRGHEQRTLLHQAARALHVDVAAISTLSSSRPNLGLLTPAVPVGRKVLSPSLKKPLPAAPAHPGGGTTVRERAIEATTIALLVAGLLAFPIGLLLPGHTPRQRHSQVMTIGSVTAGENILTNGHLQRGQSLVGPLVLKQGCHYEVRMILDSTHPGQDVQIRYRVIVLKKDTKTPLAIEHLHRSLKRPDQVVFDLVSFVPEKRGPHMLLVEVMAPNVSSSGSFRLLEYRPHTARTIVIAGSVLLMSCGVLLCAVRHRLE